MVKSMYIYINTKYTYINSSKSLYIQWKMSQKFHQFHQLDRSVPACHGATGCSHVTAGRRKGRVWHSLTSLRWLQRQVQRCRHATSAGYIQLDFYYRIIPPNSKMGFALHILHLCGMIAIKSYIYVICHQTELFGHFPGDSP